MARDFPDWLNPWTTAQGRRRFEGTVPLVRMDRLARLLESDAGEAAFTARFYLDEEKRPVVELAVSAELALMCQASLAPYRETVERRSTLGVVETEAEMGLLPSHYDPVQVDNGRLALATLVEDELILGLPAVPRNPDVALVDYETGEAPDAKEVVGERPNPFAALKGKIGRS